jgi:hypothetical protein
MKKLLTILCLVLLSSYSYSKEDIPDGPHETFYENGQLEIRNENKTQEQIPHKSYEVSNC